MRSLLLLPLLLAAQPGWAGISDRSTDRAVDLVDRLFLYPEDLDATERITMAKLLCCRVARQVADECIQLHGGYGYMKESLAGRAFVDSRLGSIGGGSDGTMLHYLAKQLGF